jgi:hypothetical protein
MVLDAFLLVIPLIINITENSSNICSNDWFATFTFWFSNNIK